MNSIVKVIAALVGLVLVAVGGGFVWAKSIVAAKLERQFEFHEASFAVPFALSDSELAVLRKMHIAKLQQRQTGEQAEVHAGAQTAMAQGEQAGGQDSTAPIQAPADPLAGVDLDAVALRRAVARGKHLVQSRYVCVECHGEDFGGGVMVDDPAMGRLLGPNITQGKGSKVLDYTPSDWDHIMRHGVCKDGKPALMPAEDFQRMSDQELSDVVAYIRSRPPVDNVVPESVLGPLGTVLAAVGKLPLAVDMIANHDIAHDRRPPAAASNAEFGKHLANVCTGCHRGHLEGGPIQVGPPNWPPASNLTPHDEGLRGWTFDQFQELMIEGKRPDGTLVRDPMSRLPPYAKKMSNVEMKALWAYLQSLPSLPTGQ